MILSFRKIPIWLLPLYMLLHAPYAGAQNYIDYYRSIAKAEHLFVYTQYKEALQQYNNAFAAYPYNNPTDCYIAAQLAAYTADTASCLSFLRKGLCFGLPLVTVKGNLHLKPYVLEGNAYALQPATTDSCKEIYLSFINRQVRSELLALFKRDQEIVHKAMPGGLYKPGTFILKDRYKPLWDSLFNEVLRITKESGFPAQKIAGPQQGDDGQFKASPHAAFAYFILIHYRTSWQQMGSLLHTELTKGNITPQMYAALADNSNGHSDEERMHYFALRPCDTKKCNMMLRHPLQEINAARDEIGLCSYAVMEEKHKATQQYYKELRSGNLNTTGFDFQPDLHFMNQ